MPRRIFSLIAILCLLTTIRFSQETRGTIAGKVSDPSGATIPAAKILVTNKAMGTATNLTPTKPDSIRQPI